MNWNMNKLDIPECDLKSLFELANESIEAVMGVVRNFANLNDQTGQNDVVRNQRNVLSLR